MKDAVRLAQSHSMQATDYLGFFGLFSRGRDGGKGIVYKGRDFCLYVSGLSVCRFMHWMHKVDGVLGVKL